MMVACTWALAAVSQSICFCPTTPSHWLSWALISLAIALREVADGTASRSLTSSRVTSSTWLERVWMTLRRLTVETASRWALLASRQTTMMGQIRFAGVG